MGKHHKVTEEFLVTIEKAARLKVITGFEKRVLKDRKAAIEEYSMKAVFTAAQFEVLTAMALRYDAVKRRGTDD